MTRGSNFGPILARSFYLRPTVEVARDLLGRVLEHDGCAGQIVETEAYLGTDDLAAHSARGVTPRTQVIFGPPGRAYVYFIYGMHECLNLVCEPEGTAGCVLIRALEPLAGLDLMQARRGRESVKELLSGPGKLCEAMGITRALNGTDVTRGKLVVRRGLGNSFETGVTERIGISKSQDRQLRFVVKGSAFVSGKSKRAG